MIGQLYLQDKLNKLTLSTLSSTLLLLGDSGCGKHLFVSLMQKKLSIDVIDITENISYELIEAITLSTNTCMYVINLSKCSEKTENVILKLLEEPLNNTYLVLLARSKSNVIPTIYNRCQVWEFSTYSDDDLKYFTDDVELMHIAKTPGNIIKYQEEYKKLNPLSLVNNIITNIKNANWANILVISNKIDYKESTGNINFDLFVDCLLYGFYMRIVSGENLYTGYELTKELSNDRYIFNINKQHLFEHYLFELKKSI